CQSHGLREEDSQIEPRATIRRTQCRTFRRPSGLLARRVSPAREGAPPTPPASSRATAWPPIRCPSRSHGCIPFRPPALVIVLRELEVVAWAVHRDSDVSDARPQVQPDAKVPECSIIRRHGGSGEADCCPQELAAWVSRHARSVQKVSLDPSQGSVEPVPL